MKSWVHTKNELQYKFIRNKCYKCRGQYWISSHGFLRYGGGLQMGKPMSQGTQAGCWGSSKFNGNGFWGQHQAELDCSCRDYYFDLKI